MSHEPWDDDKIEDLLRKTPKMQDQRSKDDVLNRLKEDGLFDEQPETVNNKKLQGRNTRIISTLVVLAAVCLLAISIPSFMKQINSSDSAEESEVMESVEMKDARESETLETAETSDAETEEQSFSIMNATSADLRTAVYPEDVGGNTVFQLGLASDAADSIPVTVLIPNERIVGDFSNEAPSPVALYNHYAPLFNESAIGFADYHPYAGKLSEQEKSVIHMLPADQPYDHGSASLATYFASLVDTFHRSYKEVAFTAEDGSAFQFSEVGEKSRPLQLNGEGTQYNYFKFTQANGETYLAPNFRETYASVEEALVAMKEEKNDIYESVILPNIDYEVSEENGVAVVSFAEELDLEALDQVQAMQMVEAMLLTASSFGMSVQFDNVTPTHWQGFDFTKALPMPIGANEIPYDTVFQ